MNVVKGASGDVCGVLSAFGEGFLSIATSVARRPIVHSMTGFPQDCIRKWRSRRPNAFRVPYVIPMSDRDLACFVFGLSRDNNPSPTVHLKRLFQSIRLIFR